MNNLPDLVQHEIFSFWKNLASRTFKTRKFIKYQIFSLVALKRFQDVLQLHNLCMNDFQNLTRLESIKLVYGDYYYGGFCSRFPSNFTKLKTPNLKNFSSEKIDFRDLENSLSLISECENLEKIVLNRCNLTSKFFQTLSSCKSQDSFNFQCFRMHRGKRIHFYC